jgi:superfamily II RNA helicase
MKRGRVLLRDVPLDRVKRIFDSPLILPADASLARWQQILDAVVVENLKAVEIPIPNRETGTISSDESAETTPTLNCVRCPNHEACHLSRNKGVKRALEEFRRLEPQIEGVQGGLWLSFKRHMRFLQETRFVTADERLTADGLWASQLRVDQPLLIAEAIRKGALEERSPEILAGGIAPFVWDRIQEVEPAGEYPIGLGDMEAAFEGIRMAIGDLRRLKTIRGFASPSIQFWPAAALYTWAKGIPWERLCSFWSVDEGDMASLIVRTIDHLRQVHHLVETHPGLAAAAATAIALLSREPVVMDES